MCPTIRQFWSFFVVFPIFGRLFCANNREPLVAKRYTSRPVHTAYFTGNLNEPCGAQDETVSCRTMSVGKKGFFSAKSFYRRTCTYYIHICTYICVRSLYSYRRDRLCIMDLPKTWSIRTGAGVPCANTFRILYWFLVDWNANQRVCLCVYIRILYCQITAIVRVSVRVTTVGAAGRTSDWRRSNDINNQKYRFVPGSLAHYYHAPTHPFPITSLPIHSPQRQRDIVIMIVLFRPHNLPPPRKMKII